MKTNILFKKSIKQKHLKRNISSSKKKKKEYFLLLMRLENIMDKKSNSFDCSRLISLTIQQMKRKKEN